MACFSWMPPRSSMPRPAAVSGSSVRSGTISLTEPTMVVLPTPNPPAIRILTVSGARGRPGWRGQSRPRPSLTFCSRSRSEVREIGRGGVGGDPARLQQVAEHDATTLTGRSSWAASSATATGFAHNRRIRACSGCGRAARSGGGSTAVTVVMRVKSVRLGRVRPPVSVNGRTSRPPRRLRSPHSPLSVTAMPARGAALRCSPIFFTSMFIWYATTPTSAPWLVSTTRCAPGPAVLRIR